MGFVSGIRGTLGRGASGLDVCGLLLVGIFPVQDGVRDGLVQNGWMECVFPDRFCFTLL